MQFNMKLLKSFIIVVFTLAALSFAVSSASASEGVVELQSTTSQGSRCFVSSILTDDFEYKMVVSCRGLIYPPAPDMFSYVLWSVKTENGKTEKIGELGAGKGEFSTDKAFSSLFVTKERDEWGARSPSDLIVMRGQVQPIGFLEGPVPAPLVAPEEEGERTTEELQKEKVATASGGLMAGIRRAVLTFLLVIFTVGVAIAATIFTFRRLSG